MVRTGSRVQFPTSAHVQNTAPDFFVFYFHCCQHFCLCIIVFNMIFRVVKNFYSYFLPTVGTLLVASLVIISLGVCVGRNMPMGSSMNGVVAEWPCPLMGAASPLCPAQLIDHLNFWQHFSLAIPRAETGLRLLVIFVVGSVALLSRAHQALHYLHDFVRYRLYSREHPQRRLYNYLQRIFARGILQPKLFA